MGTSNETKYFIAYHHFTSHERNRSRQILIVYTRDRSKFSLQLSLL